MNLVHSFILRKSDVMKKIILFIFICCLFCGCGNSSVENDKKEITTITTDSVYTMINRDDVHIIDVREEYEYNSGHIENAINISVNDINKINKDSISLNDVVIVYCQSGNRSRKAAQVLIDLGYQNVYDMGGVNLWDYGLITE